MKSVKPLNRFVKKCCLVAQNARYPAMELYLTYVNWCVNAGVTVHDQFTFLEMLERHGFCYNQKPGRSYFEGISVKPPYRVD
jgi:phage/plasmid-associated DNA primase